MARGAILLTLLMQRASGAPVNHTGVYAPWYTLSPVKPQAVPANGRKLAVTSDSMTPMSYLHIPKCGSTFATILLRVMCNVTVDRPILEPDDHREALQSSGMPGCASIKSGHHPVPATEAHAVTMIRVPYMRVASGFMHNLHDVSGLHPAIKWENQPPDTWLKEVAKMDDKELLNIFIQYKERTECCISNMLNGHWCNEISQCDVPRALQRLDSFHFVGIQELWNDSIRKFANMHNTAPRQVEKLPARTQSHSDTYRRVISLARTFTYKDDRVYAAAVDLFHRL